MTIIGWIFLACLLALAALVVLALLAPAPIRLRRNIFTRVSPQDGYRLADATCIAYDAHQLVIAPTGGGKSHCCLAPLILSEASRPSPPSFVVLDPKYASDVSERFKELYALTAERLRDASYDVHLVDPDAPADSKAINPLAFVEDSTPWDVYARAMAWISAAERGMGRGESKGMESTWTAGAADLLAHQFTACLRNNTQPEFRALLAALRGPKENILPDHYQHAHAGGAGSIVTTAAAVIQATFMPFSGIPGRGEFDPRALRTRPMAVFVSPPATGTVFARTWLSLFMHVVVSSLLHTEGRRVMFVVDELASLTGLEAILDLLNRGRSMGLQLVAATQSLTQLQEMHGKAFCDALWSNSRLKSLMGPTSDEEVIRRLCFMSGESVDIVTSVHLSSGGEQSTTESPRFRPAVKPEWISRMRPRTCLIVLDGSWEFKPAVPLHKDARLSEIARKGKGRDLAAGGR